MLVSIIIPVYNAEKFLDSCVQSVLNQSYNKLEIILVDDSSTDNSLVKCTNFAELDSRIKVITQKNGGPASARNNGVKNASGDFIFFLDADDLLKPNTIETLISEYQKHNADLVMSNFCKLEQNGNVIDQPITFAPNSKPSSEKLIKLNQDGINQFIRHFFKHPSNHLISYCWARLYKTSIIKENDIKANNKMRLFEDFVFNLEYLKHTKSLLFVNESLYTYRMHTSHISLSMAIIQSDSLLHDMSIFQKSINSYFENSNLLEQIKKEYEHTLIHYSIIFLIRTCRQITKQNKKSVSSEINKLITSELYKQSLLSYNPQKENSRVIPFLTKHQMINFLIIYCKLKAYLRYGRLVKQ